MCRSAAVRIPALSLLALACASTQLVQTELRTGQPLPEDCVMSTVRTETGVVGFREMRIKGRAHYWFQIADPELAGEQMPSQMLTQRAVQDGWALDLAANFEARGRKAQQAREAVLRNQRQMLTRVASECAGAEIDFGPTTVCGRGEENTLCIQGTLLEPGS